MADNSRIKIRQKNDNIEIIEMPYPTTEEGQKPIEAQGGFNVFKNIRFLMRETATARLFETISWGARYKTRDVEKAGLLVGKYCQDTSRGQSVVWGDVVAIIPADPNLVRATGTDIVITQEAWRKMLDEYVPLMESNLRMLGWYHTHLGNTPPRFSGQDATTQRKYFDGKYSFAIVLNPSQKKWAVFCGPSANECKGILLANDELLARYSEPKITIQQVSGESELRQDGTVAHRNTDGSIADFPAQNFIPTDVHSPGKLFGQFFDGLGKWLSRPKQQTTDQQRTVRTKNTSVQRNVQHQQPVVPRRQVSNITIQDTAIQSKPKITILSRASTADFKRMVNSWVFKVSAANPTQNEEQGDEGLQVIEQNIIDVVDRIMQHNVNNSMSLGNPINAHIEVNSDFTFEVSLCESKDNAVIRISEHPLREAFSETVIQGQLENLAKLIIRNAVGTSYLLFVSSTPESISLVTFQIIEEDIT